MAKKPTPLQRHHYLVVVTNDIIHCSNTIIIYATETEIINILNQFNKPENIEMTQMHMTVYGKDEDVYN